MVLGGQLTCSKGGMGGIGSPQWPDAIMVPFEECTAIMPRGGNIHEIWGFIHLSVSIIRGRGKIGELYSRIRS